jgi:RNA polymerase sigma-70 factor (ECF subfamily)
MTQDSSSDSFLVLAGKGDPVACEALMRRHNRRLFRIVRAVLGNDADAEDAVQDTYIRAFAALDAFAGQSSFETWLTAIALNEAKARLRRRRDLASLADIEETQLQAALHQSQCVILGVDPEEEAARAEMRQLIERAIDGLPTHFRSVFVLRAVERLSVRETAGLLEIPEPTVKTRFHRARNLLRRSLGQTMRDAMPEIFAFDGKRCDRIVAAVLNRINLRLDREGVSPCDPRCS